MAAFEGFYKGLIGTTGFTEVTPYFTMETIKETTALPIQNIDRYKNSGK